jgi:hypothetical protein
MDRRKYVMDNEDRPLRDSCWTDLQIVELPNVTPRMLAEADYPDDERVAVVVDVPNHLVFAVMPRLLRRTGWPLRAGAPDRLLAGSPLLTALQRGQRLALADAPLRDVLDDPRAAEAPLVIAVTDRGRPVGLAVPGALSQFAATGLLPVSLPEALAYREAVIEGTVEEYAVSVEGVIAGEYAASMEGVIAGEYAASMEGVVAWDYATSVDDVVPGEYVIVAEEYAVPAGDDGGAASFPGLPPSAPSIGDFGPDRRIFSIAPEPGVCVHADGSWHFADPCPCGNQG